MTRGKRTKKQAKESTPKRTQDSSFVDYVREHGDDIGQVMAKLTVEKARAGNTRAAYEILQDFVGAIDQYNERTWNGLRSAPIHWEYVSYIAEAFEKVIRGAMRSPAWTGTKWTDVEDGEVETDANLALGIRSSKPGRRRGWRTHDEEALAAAYWFLRRRGFAAEKAAQSLSDRTGANRRTIQRASQSGGNLAFKHPQLIDDEILKSVFGRRYAAEIAAILAADR